MKTIITALLVCLGLTSLAQTPTTTITVTVENAKSNDGNMLIGLHTADTFMKGQGIQNLESKIENGKATFEFSNVEAGTYALLVLHDENSNYAMDYDANGMPQESWGVSNNSMTFGPPQFSEAKFTVEGKPLELTIRL